MTAARLETVQFEQPATLEQLGDVEDSLSVVLPTALKDLLLETDGVVFPYGRTVFSAARLIEENVTMRTTGEFKELYWPFDGILFFADDGNGDLFGFKALGGNAQDWCFSVYRWDHETDSRTDVAGAHLNGFLGEWIANDGRELTREARRSKRFEWLGRLEMPARKSAA